MGVLGVVGLEMGSGGGWRLVCGLEWRVLVGGGWLVRGNGACSGQWWWVAIGLWRVIMGLGVRSGGGEWGSWKWE